MAVQLVFSDERLWGELPVRSSSPMSALSVNEYDRLRPIFWGLDVVSAMTSLPWSLVQATTAACMAFQFTLAADMAQHR